MPVLASKGTMLYCPKCQSKYKDGNQRFCDNEGVRLLPVDSLKEQTLSSHKAVFTSLLQRTAPTNDRDERLASSPKFVKFEKKNAEFEPPKKSAAFNTRQDLKPQIPRPRVAKSDPLDLGRSEKSVGKLVNPSKVSANQADLDKKRLNQEGKSGLSWQDPHAFVGQTVKGRYSITEKLDQDQTSIAFLAEDMILEGKKVVVRVIMEKVAKDDLLGVIFAEERVALAHINHPNVVKVVDSGELSDVKPFVVTEYEDGNSVLDVLNQTGKFDPMRTARIIRQASRALSEMHQNGILHRNLKPEHIVLMTAEAGIEQAKVSNFCVSDGTPRVDNLEYKSPEQLGRQLPTFASDGYSLAAIAFRLLTGRLPFKGDSGNVLLKSQKAGLLSLPSDFEPELPKIIDSILEKALSYNPSDRYSNVRDFGDTFFNALTTSFFLKRTEYDEFASSDSVQKEAPKDESPLSAPVNKKVPKLVRAADTGSAVKTKSETTPNTESQPTTDSELPWKKRSSDDMESGALSKVLRIAIPLLILTGAIFSLVYLWNRNDGKQSLQATNPAEQVGAKKNIEEDPKFTGGSESEIEVPPPARQIIPPPNSRYFENVKQDLNTKLANNYRGFTIYYPRRWKKNNDSSSFLDISNKGKGGLPVEQIIITHYESKGTFGSDKESFPKLVAESNKSLEALPIPNYKMISKRDIIVNGWKAHEVKFQGSGTASNGEALILWGRRIWIPAARPGVKTGFVITLLATSLSDVVKSVDDVGEKGELGKILKTFEPTRNYD